MEEILMRAVGVYVCVSIFSKSSSLAVIIDVTVRYVSFSNGMIHVADVTDIEGQPPATHESTDTGSGETLG
jgi:hypothetical protein